MISLKLSDVLVALLERHLHTTDGFLLAVYLLEGPVALPDQISDDLVAGLKLVLRPVEVVALGHERVGQVEASVTQPVGTSPLALDLSLKLCDT